MSYGFNSTIKRKQKICKSCGFPKFIFSKGRCADCARIEDTMKRMEEESEKVIEKEGLSELIAIADDLVSKYVRMSAADKNGVCECYTCGDRKHYTLMDAGHYVKRGNLFLRFDLRNLRVQCQDCNRIKYGNMGEYTKRLEQERPGITDILREEAAIVYKPTRDEIRAIITEYTPKVRSLKKTIKNG